jgi:hypothetical protein
MALSIRTTNRGVSPLADHNMDGWGGEKGLRNQIKGHHQSMYTSRKDKTDITRLAEHETELRIKELSSNDQYGTFMRAKNQNRGNDYMRTIDYVGNNSTTDNIIKSSSGVGKPLGKNDTIRNINISPGIFKENIRGHYEAQSRQGVHNTGVGDSSKLKSHFATPETSRIYKGPEKPALKENFLLTSVKANQTYMPKHTGISFNTDINSNIISKISIDGYSGNSTKNRFEPTKYHPTITETKDEILYTKGFSGVSTKNRFEHEKQHESINQIRDLLNIGINTEKYYLPHYEGYKSLPVLTSKTTAYNVRANNNSKTNHKTIMHENNILNKPDKPIFSFTPTRRIEKPKLEERQTYKFRKDKPDLTKYSLEPKPTIPSF